MSVTKTLDLRFMSTAGSDNEVVVWAECKWYLDAVAKSGGGIVNIMPPTGLHLEHLLTSNGYKFTVQVADTSTLIAEYVTVMRPVTMYAVTVAGSVPEPEPLSGGEYVTPKLIDRINSLSLLSEEAKREAVQLVKQREIYGLNKYGKRLSTLNGRDPIEDGKQEIGDLWQYMQQAIEEKRDLNPLYSLMDTTRKLMEI